VAARFRPGGPACPAEGATAAMASLARRHQQLTAEITRLDAMLDELVRHAAPAQFLAKKGVATQVAATLLATAGDNPGRVRTEASFAALCGASPVDASSGKRYIARETYKALCRPQRPARPSAPKTKQDLSARVLT
jgi:transposase